MLQFTTPTVWDIISITLNVISLLLVIKSR